MERVQKLEQRISDVEEEVEKLVRLSPKDLWNKDLDEFIEAYRNELEEEAQLAKDNKKKVRRISMANKGNKKASKRKAADDTDGDADFGMAKAKKKPAIERVEPKRNGLFDFFSKQSPPSKPPGKYVLVNGREQPMSALGATDGAMDIDEEPAAPAAHGGRAAARKPVKYAVSDDDSDDDGDDMLGDVSAMVKGIGGGDSSRTLFRQSISRPNSSGNPPIGHSKSTSRGASKPTVVDLDENSDVDDTDYAKLVPQGSPEKPAARTAKDVKISDDEDDEESLEVLAPPARSNKTSKPAPASKPAAAPKPKKAPAAKATKSASVEPAPPKPVQLSPAAKAYAKKLAGKTDVKPSSSKAAAPSTAATAKPKKKVVRDESEDDEDPNDLANDLLDDGDDDVDDSPPAKAAAPAPTGRARRAAPPKKYNYVVSDDSEDDDEESELDIDDDESE